MTAGRRAPGHPVTRETPPVPRPADGEGPPVRPYSTDKGRLRALVSLGLGACGVAGSVASRRWPGLLAVVVTCWSAALWVFATLVRPPPAGSEPDRPIGERSVRARRLRSAEAVAPGLRTAGRLRPMVPDRKWLVVPAAVAVSIAASRAWPLVPLALAGWVLATRLLGVRWSSVLTGAVVVLAGAAVASAAGAEALGENLAVLAYALASVSCGAALLQQGGDRL